jgi:protein-disulfide isomerase
MDEQQVNQSKSASGTKTIVLAVLIAALAIIGTVLGATQYLSNELNIVKAQLLEVGSVPAFDRPDAEAPAPRKIDMAKVLQDNDPVRGPKSAKVTIVEFSDYECPFCGRFYKDTLPDLIKEYGDDVKFIFKDFPLPFHNNAPKAHEAAHCAGEQGKYWDLHALMFDNQRQLGLEQLRGHAQKIKLDMAKFNTCLDSGRFTDKVKKDTATGRDVGVTGTPTFFINGQRLVGAQPLEAFRTLIDKELGR